MRIMIWFFLMSLFTGLTTAQTTWNVETNCMSEFTYPVVEQDAWDFPGVIVTSAYPEGIRGIQGGDRRLEYFIALSSDDTFPAIGAISPDGQYFAYPIGHTNHRVNAVNDDLIYVDNLRVVRTDGNTDETFLLEANNFAYSGAIGVFNLPPVRWFGSEWVYYPPKFEASDTLMHISSDETRSLRLSVNLSDLRFISPDGTRAFHSTLHNLDTDRAIDYSLPRYAAWFADSSGFIAADESHIDIVDRDGNIQETIDIPHVTRIAVAPDQSAFAFWNEQQQLFIADVTEKTVYDVCFQESTAYAYIFDFLPEVTNLAWSSDSESLAFSHDNYLILLNTATLESQILNHYSRYVIAWSALD